MKHTDAEIEEAARRFEQLAGELDPESVQVEDLADLRAVPKPPQVARSGLVGLRGFALTAAAVPGFGPERCCCVMVT